MDITLSNLSLSWMGWLAIATGGVALIRMLRLILFFALGQPFATLNDICIALAGILSGVLAWMSFSGQHAQSPLLSQLALMAAVVGVGVVILGSALVIFRVTGWVLYGFYMQFGNALIGLWLLRLRLSAQHSAAWPRGLVLLGSSPAGSWPPAY